MADTPCPPIVRDLGAEGLLGGTGDPTDAYRRASAVLAEIRSSLPPPISVPAGRPGPDGIARAYPIRADIADLLFPPASPVPGLTVDEREAFDCRAQPALVTIGQMAEIHDRLAIHEADVRELAGFVVARLEVP